MSLYIDEIIKQEQPDIFIVAEGENLNTTLLFNNSFKELESTAIQIPRYGNKYIRTFFNSNINAYDIENLDEYRCSIKGFKTQINGKMEEIIFIPVHFPSKINGDNNREVEYYLNFIDQKIDAILKRRKSDKCIILGDFNVNPYEPSIMESKYMKISNCPYGSSTIKKKRVFYNPSSYLLANFDQVSLGSYHKTNWYLLDQVIFLRSLYNYFDKNKLKIVDCKTSTLLNIENKKPIVSDHLPISISFDFNKK